MRMGCASGERAFGRLGSAIEDQRMGGVEGCDGFNDKVDVEAERVYVACEYVRSEEFEL